MFDLYEYFTLLWEYYARFSEEIVAITLANPSAKKNTSIKFPRGIYQTISQGIHGINLHR